MTITPELLDAYLATHYRVEHPAGFFTLRIGQPSSELRKLLQASGVGGAAFLTAWNPHSRLTSAADNALAQQRLLAELRALDYVTFPAIGLDPTGQWPGEESVFILGLPSPAAMTFGRRYAQHAVVWVGEDAIPQLLFCH